MGRRLQVLAVIGLAAVVVAVAIVVSSGGSDGEPPSSSEPAADVTGLYDGIPQDGIHLGDADAPATLIEFADLQCPFCAQYSTHVLPTIVEQYVRTGRVRYELRIRAFLGRDSVRAAGAAAEAADQDLMYPFVDAFFRNQGPENSGYADADFIRRIAGEVEGLDVERVVAAADDPLRYPILRRNEMLARELGSNSTPDFYVRRAGRVTHLEPQGTAPADYAAALDAALGGS